MRVLGVIPARSSSTRFPNKPLAKILGKPMILWVLDGAKNSSLLDHLIVATDDERIAEMCETHNADVIMTSPTCQTGTERVAEVAKKLHMYDIIVNIQGDEPLIKGSIIDKIIEDLINTPSAGISTGVIPAKNTVQTKDKNNVKVVLDLNGFAMYFSRSLIPSPRLGITKPMIHIGVYAYRWEELLRLSRLSQTPLEREESLEQLRALENGIKIHCVKLPENTVLIGVDTPEDIKKVERVLLQQKRFSGG